jgi:uncharacterized tellurite resistance protein B-like protein
MHPNDQAAILTLAKVLVATAWADGELSHDEVTSMKRDLLTRIPDLSAQQWASVDIYIEAPVDESERTRLVQMLRSHTTTPQGRQLVFEALDNLVAADGHVSDEERRAIDEVRAALEGGGAGSVRTLSRRFRGGAAAAPAPAGAAGGAPAGAPAGAPDREVYLDDFVKNRVYYVVRRRLEQGGIVPRLPEAAIRKLCLAGGMMAVVARVMPEVTDDERVTMLDMLKQHWHLDADQADFLVDVALSQLPADLDRFRLADEFAAVSDLDERGRLVDVLFAIAAADGEVALDETETIRGFANAMVLTHDRFIEAKLKTRRPEG